MAQLDEKSLQNQIKSGQLSNLYYFCGSDLVAVENCVRRMIKAVGGAENVTRLDGQNLDLNQLAEEIELCPMFAEYNCIQIHDCNAETLRENDRKFLLEIIKQVSGQTILIFDVTGFDIYGGKTGKNKKPTAKNKKLIDYILKAGTVCFCEPKSVSQIATEIISGAKKQGCMIERPAAMALAMQCNSQTLMIQNELNKLCAYVNGGVITEQLIYDMVTPQLETTVYALTTAILKRKASDALKVVEELLALRVEMPYLMAVVSGCLIDIQRASAARKAGKTVQDVMSDFNYQFSFAVERSFRDSMGETPEHITECLNLLCEAEKKMHSGTVDERVLFEKTVIEMLRK
ncbi:MAG: DNA polymerase III subunit delta [Oscillospiraceae bacterium]|nr:DNA polymerase III subunit delta [Oscillospiraceae bacterium]